MANGRFQIGPKILIQETLELAIIIDNRLVIKGLTFTFISCILLALTSCQTKQKEHLETIYLVSLPDTIINTFNSGDIIVRKGGGALSHAIMSTTNEPYSHCGIIISNKDSTFVIHSMAGMVSTTGEDGVQALGLAEFTALTADSMLYVVRPISSDSIGRKIAKEALLMYESRLPYDHRYNLGSEHRIYCSELIYRAFINATGHNIFKIRKQHKLDILLFETFNDSTKFKMIYDLKGSNVNSGKIEDIP